MKKLLSGFGLNADDLNITNESPVYRISPVKYVWEVRRDMGLEFDPDDPKQKLFYSELKNKFTTDTYKNTPDNEIESTE